MLFRLRKAYAVAVIEANEVEFRVMGNGVVRGDVGEFEYSICLNIRRLKVSSILRILKKPFIRAFLMSGKHDYFPLEHKTKRLDDYCYCQPCFCWICGRA